MTDTVRDVLLAFVRMHVLHHSVSERVYGAGMTRELARHGYRLSPGTLYPLLHRLEADGLLASETEVVGGRTRKVYVATAKGRRAFAALQLRLAELVGETLPEQAADDARRRSRPRR